MAQVLVVEDSPDQARLIGGLLESAGHTVETRADGRQALDAIDEHPPDIVVTDLMMPELDGLELVREVTCRYPALPIILMTAHGSGEIAMKALRQGAAGYVPKRLIHDELTDNVERILDLASSRRERERTLRSMDETEMRFVLPTDPSMISPLVDYVREMIAGSRIGLDETELMQIGLALQEALLNAVYHGNLGLGSAIREESNATFQALGRERLEQPPYRDRRVRLRATVKGSELTLVVGDEGAGFDLSAVPDPTDSEFLLRASGRGLFLIGTFMDRLFHNEVGNEITMVKRLREDPA